MRRAAEKKRSATEEHGWVGASGAERFPLDLRSQAAGLSDGLSHPCPSVSSVAPFLR